MRIELIFCPSCNRKLRVPENLMARPVQCPECGARYVAPPTPEMCDGPPAERAIRRPRVSDDDELAAD